MNLRLAGDTVIISPRQKTDQIALGYAKFLADNDSGNDTIMNPCSDRFFAVPSDYADILCRDQVGIVPEFLDVVFFHPLRVIVDNVRLLLSFLQITNGIADRDLIVMKQALTAFIYRDFIVFYKLVAR